MIDTIRSRAVTFTMQPYSEKQLEKYINDNGLHNDVLKLAKNIGECNELSTINITEIKDMVDNIIKELDLYNVEYYKLASYGHFGRNELNLPWEKTKEFID